MNRATLCAWALAAGAAAAPVNAAGMRTIVFAGQTWSVKNSAGALWGPGPNRFSDSTDNVWVDQEGKLHLAITQVGGQWQSAEVISQASFGYGSYRFTIDTPLDALDANVVLGLFTWSDQRAYHHREIDIEFARWGNPANPFNAQYTVQPYTTNGNQRAWNVQPGYTSATTHSFRWTRNSVDFTSTTLGNTLQQWSYTRRNGIPRPGGENARLNLWLFNGAAPLNGQPVEIVVSGFVFTP
jgi:Glycosyl hydrolases family 16